MQWLLSIGGYSAERVDGHEKKANRQEMTKGRESRACRAGAGRVLLRPRGREDGPARLLLGNADRDHRAGVARNVPARCATRSSGRTLSSNEAPRDVLRLLRDGRGRRDRQRDDEDGLEERTGFVDYEVGQAVASPGRELPADHRRRLRGGHLLRPEERHHPAVDRERSRSRSTSTRPSHSSRVQRAQGDGHPGRSREDARRRGSARGRRAEAETTGEKADNGQAAGGPA